MSPNSNRRRRIMRFRMIVYPTSGALATWRGSTISSNPDIGRREPSKVSDKRSAGACTAEWHGACGKWMWPASVWMLGGVAVMWPRWRDGHWRGGSSRKVDKPGSRQRAGLPGLQ